MKCLTAIARVFLALLVVFLAGSSCSPLLPMTESEYNSHGNGGAQVATPTFSPGAGTYSSDQSVSINCATSGAAIHYTTDGSTPSGSSALFTLPISAAGNGTIETIKAIATKTGLADSSVNSATYTVYDTWQTIGTQGSGTDQFNLPYGPTVDKTGHIYIPDLGNSRIVRIDDMKGTNWTTFGTNGSGTDQFNQIPGIAVDGSGHIYVSDLNNNRIVRFDDMNGTNWTTFGTVGKGTNQFAQPNGIAVDAGGHIYVADFYNDRIVRMDDMNGTNWTALGSFYTMGNGTNQFHYPFGVAVDGSGHIYVSDQVNNRIVRMDDMNGTNWTTFGTFGAGTDQFNQISGIALDGSGHIYVADYGNNRIVRMDDMNGTNWTTLGTIGTGLFQFAEPVGIAVDTSGHVYVADWNNNRIVRFIMP